VLLECPCRQEGALHRTGVQHFGEYYLVPLPALDVKEDALVLHSHDEMLLRVDKRDEGKVGGERRRRRKKGEEKRREERKGRKGWMDG